MNSNEVCTPAASGAVSLREKVAQAHDLSLDGDHVECRAVLHEVMAALAPQGPVVDEAAMPRLIGWRTEDYLMETADQAVALNWQSHHRILPIFAGDTQTRLATPPPAPVADAGLVRQQHAHAPPYPDAAKDPFNAVMSAQSAPIAAQTGE